MHYNNSMKSATIPSVRVDPELRSEVEALLSAGETLSEFVESSVRDMVRRRRHQAEFLARGLRSLESAKRTGAYVDADVVIGRLERKLAGAIKRKTASKR